MSVKIIKWLIKIGLIQEKTVYYIGGADVFAVGEEVEKCNFLKTRSLCKSSCAFS